MKSIFEKSSREELIARVHTLNENSTAVWGKMNLVQMLLHSIKWEEMALGKQKYKQSFIGKVFGKMAIKSMLKDEQPMKRNLPTVPGFDMKETKGDVVSLRNRWVELMKEHDHISNDDFVHPFFGKMTRNQLGQLAYKHTDHHLRQFGS